MKDKYSPWIAVDTAVFGNLESVNAIESTFQMVPGDQKHKAQIPMIPHTSIRTHSFVAEEPSVTLLSELVSMIISNLNGRSQKEMAFLWMTVRNVSKSFRTEIERVFKKEHMGKTKLIVDCGCFCWCCNTFYFDREEFYESLTWEESLRPGSHDGLQQLDTTLFEFGRFDESDPDRAIFATIKKDQQGAEKVFRGFCYKLGYRDKDPLMRDLKQLPSIGQQPSRIPLDEEHTERAAPIFQLRGGISDGEIKGMKLHTESLEISIYWKATLTMFFGRIVAASKINMLVYKSGWPDDERPVTLWERRVRWSVSKAPYDRAKDELQLTYLQEQVRAWRRSCEDTLGKPTLSAEGLRKRRIADLKLNLDDDGRAGRPRTFHGGVGDTFDPYLYLEGPR